MNKAEIKAELRRSALYDKYPCTQCNDAAWSSAYWFSRGEHLWHSPLDVRTFYFLVAEAL